MPALAEVITLIEGRVTCFKVGLVKPGSFLSSHSHSFSSELSAGLTADQALLARHWETLLLLRRVRFLKREGHSAEKIP